MVMSHLADRLKINSGLYFLITVTSILCFLTISGTLLLSKVALYGTDRENSLAYTYRTYNIHNQADLKFHQDNITYITQAIQAEGYNVRVNTLDDSVYLILQSNRYIPKFYEDEVDLSYFDQHLAGDKKILYLVPLSEYNQMAKFNKKAPLTLKSAREIVILSPQQRPPQEIFSGKVLYGEGEGVHLDNVPFRFVKGHYGAGRNLMNISVVSDSYFDEIKAMEQPESAPTKKNEADQGQETLTFPFQIIHFRQWRKAPQVDKRVRTFLNERQEQLEASLEKADISDPLSSDVTFFDYTSSYQTYSQKKQESGSTLLISVLIASVYIVFSTCILYFRIFGELRQDRRQHKTLHVLGVPAKNRHRLITIEMWVMFFLPSSLSLLSYAIIIISAQRLFAVSLSLTMAQLILGSVLFEIFFFLYARTRYIRQIDYYLEKTAST